VVLHISHSSPFSKLANILFAKELQRRFEAEGVQAVAIAVHPGRVLTGALSYFQNTFVFVPNLSFSRIVTLVSPANLSMLNQSLSGALTPLFDAINNTMGGEGEIWRSISNAIRRDRRAQRKLEEPRAGN
jgi:NAD(P)-dependent dehydrogenase (short-subunit alcohol dehydrogenase family)